MRGLSAVAVALMVGMPGVALAESPDRPVVELDAVAWAPFIRPIGPKKEAP